MSEQANASLAGRLATIRSELRELQSVEQAVQFFELGKYDRLLKSTISLCSTCLGHVPALVYANDKRVWMQKKCPVHGVSMVIVENDEEFYKLSNKDQWGIRYSQEKELCFPSFKSGCDGGGESGGDVSDALENFTDQFSNKSCTILVEVTNACNLKCAVCYSDAKGDRKLPLRDFRDYILQLIARKKTLDSVQLTGGEAVLHPEFWEMVQFLYDRPEVKKIYLPSNGIEFVRGELADRLVPYREKLMFLLQFDGETTESNQALRNAHTGKVREAVIKNLGERGIAMQLTMTITLGVNDHEIGWVIDQGMKWDHIKVVALQPVTYSGRYDLAQDPCRRLTLSDVVKAVATQAGSRLTNQDFKTIPCSHPNCGWITLFARRFGLRFNIARHIDLESAMSRVANRTLLNTGELRSVIGTSDASPTKRLTEWMGKKLVRSTDIFAIAIKPFMDKYNYDQDRISACCHHLLDTQGRPVSFCEYNARLRFADSWAKFPKVSTVEAGK